MSKNVVIFNVETPKGDHPYCIESSVRFIKTWKKLHKNKANVKQVNFSADFPLSKIQKKLESADLIVFPASGPEQASIALELRKNMEIRAPFVFHVDEGALKTWLNFKTLYPHLKNTDLFICSSGADSKILKLLYSNCNTVSFPDPVLEDQLLGRKIKRKPSTKAIFLNRGEISEQNNLHTVFIALWILQQMEPDLHWEFYLLGSEGSGISNSYMGRNSTCYLEHLYSLAKKLHLKDRIFFIQDLEENLKLKMVKENSHIYISSGLNFEKNNSVAEIMGSLKYGNRAVLSDWGVHREFLSFFPLRTFSVDVAGQKNGPFVSPMELAESLLKSVTSPQPENFSIPLRSSFREFAQAKLVKEYEVIVAEMSKSRNLRAVGLTKLSRQILENTRQNNFRKDRVFDSFSDPLCRELFKAFGMKSIGKPSQKSASRVLLVPPWVKKNPRSLSIRDPHRGNFKFSSGQKKSNIRVFSPLDGSLKPLKSNEAEYLLKNGFALPAWIPEYSLDS